MIITPPLFGPWVSCARYLGAALCVDTVIYEFQ